MIGVEIVEDKETKNPSPDLCSKIRDEMFQKGVTCSDCHDPHNLELHFPGDAVCFRCHSQKMFATPEHHFHQPDTPGAFCVDCHIPPKNYMVVDPRHDHSLRMPRPDLSLKLGTTDACSQCHQDKPIQWSVDAVAKWYGPDRRAEPRYGEALHAARAGLPEAEAALVGLVEDPEMTAIVRATALSLLQRYLTPSSLATVEKLDTSIALGGTLEDPTWKVRSSVGDHVVYGPGWQTHTITPVYRRTSRFV